MDIATQIFAIICLILAIAALLLLLWQRMFQHKQQKIHDDNEINLVNITDTNDFDRYLASEKAQQAIINIIQKNRDRIKKYVED